MKFQHVAAAGLLVVAVHVLGDQRLGAVVFESRQGLVGGVGLGLGDQSPAPIIPTPDQFGIAGEGLGRGQFLGAVAAPETVLFSAEGGDATGGGNSRSGQHGDPGGRRDFVPQSEQFFACGFIQRHVGSFTSSVGWETSLGDSRATLVPESSIH